MTNTALKGFGTRRTPQSEPIPGSGQVPNAAGGYAWEVDPWQRLRRFLILGTDGGTYYIGESQLTKENAEAVLKLIAQDGPRVLAMVREVSENGRAPKNDQALFVLAMAAKLGDDKTRRLALADIPAIARTGTHLFQFVGFMEQFGGWSKATKRAIARWYTADARPEVAGEPGGRVRDLDHVALQLVKYRQREDWTHADVLGLCRPGSDSQPKPTPEQDMLFRWATNRKYEHSDAERRPVNYALVPGIVYGFELCQGAATAADAATIVRQYRLPRECVPTEFLKSPEVWEALLFEGGKHGMPITALIRNLANMTRAGLLTPTSDGTKKVVEMLGSQPLLKHGRVHPLNVLNGMKTYAQGHGERGSNTWAPVPTVIDALDEAFYLAFDNVEPTNKRWLLGLDVSGSMDGRHFGYGFANVSGMPNLTPREAATAMAMVAARSGDPYECVAFTAATSPRYARMGYNQGDVLMPGLSALPISGRQRLDDIVKRTRELYPGGTDASLPMQWAADAEREVDVFALYTDSETWAGRVHPQQALQAYRERSGIDAKLICVNMVANRSTIADPNDPGTLDVVGFDTAAPTLMNEFALGRL